MTTPAPTAHRHSLTCHTHEFLVSGCRNQWVADHDTADCWAAFLAHNGAPAGLSVDGFYDWKYPNG